MNGRDLTQWREGQGLTVEELGQKICASPEQIKRWESGEDYARGVHASALKKAIRQSGHAPKRSKRNKSALAKSRKKRATRRPSRKQKKQEEPSFVEPVTELVEELPEDIDLYEVISVSMDRGAEIAAKANAILLNELFGFGFCPVPQTTEEAEAEEE